MARNLFSVQALKEVEDLFMVRSFDSWAVILNRYPDVIAIRLRADRDYRLFRTEFERVVDQALQRIR